MKQIIITTAENTLRAAVIENEKLIDLLDDTSRESRFAGSIFLGRVKNVVPGIQAAFIDIGLEKNAFLYVGDVIAPGYSINTENVNSDKPQVVPKIENCLKEGQEIVVQVIREQTGNKGPRVTTNLSVPGRYAVLFPGWNETVNVSRKIKDTKERQRLYALGRKYKPDNTGMIIRTLAEGVEEEKFNNDIQRSAATLDEINQKIKYSSKKGLIYYNSDPLSRLLREIIDDQVKKIVIDDGELAGLLREKLRNIGSVAADKVWTDLKGSLFERYAIFSQIQKALIPKVPLDSGGYLIIEQTEALTVIDINSGKYIGNQSLQETLLELNLEAAREICRQIRLRNLSGIIVIDFVDMEKEQDWEYLLESLQDFLAEDKVRCKVVGRTRLGLVEVTRKKEGQTLSERYTEVCPKCSGRGRILKDYLK